MKSVKLNCKTDEERKAEHRSDEWENNKEEVRSDIDTCFHMIVCQAPLRSTERQGQQSSVKLWSSSHTVFMGTKLFVRGLHYREWQTTAIHSAMKGKQNPHK